MYIYVQEPTYRCASCSGVMRQKKCNCCGHIVTGVYICNSCGRESNTFKYNNTTPVVPCDSNGTATITYKWHYPQQDIYI